MREVLLIICLLGLAFSGYITMKHLDCFLEANQKKLKKENENKDPSCVMLTDELTEEEILAEIHRFRKIHEGIRIFLCTEEEEILSEENEKEK